MTNQDNLQTNEALQNVTTSGDNSVSKADSKKSKKLMYFEMFVMVIAIVGPLTNLPQLFQIISSKSAGGVSLISWSLFALISAIWMIYGLTKKDNILILTNIALIVVQGSIAISILIYG